jgi:hypothetical protein
MTYTILLLYYISIFINIVKVENRTADTLLACIKQWIMPGTTIISDCWKAYDKIE